MARDDELRSSLYNRIAVTMLGACGKVLGTLGSKSYKSAEGHVKMTRVHDRVYNKCFKVAGSV